MIEIDHICLGVRNVYEGAHRLREETGLGNYEGGWFPPLGLANRILPLGDDTYIEVEGVVDVFKVEEGNPVARWFRDMTAAGDVFIGWCARVRTRTELEAVARRLKTDVLERQVRMRPDGSWPISRLVPATIECWKAGIPNFFLVENIDSHPARQPINGPGLGPRGISWMEVGGSEEEMSDWLGIDAGTLSLRFNGKSPGLYAVAVRTADGEKVIKRPSIGER